MCRIATLRPSSTSITSSRELARELAKLFSSPNWQTFLVVAQEQGASPRPPFPSSAQWLTYALPRKAPAPPARTYPGGSDADQQQPQTIDGFEIPPDIDVPPESASASGANTAAGAGHGDVAMDGSGAAAAPGGMRVCPHCTFENPPGGGQDCEVCGLPLQG